jgi:NAD(P)-dependent dehydrogenase (short-subunit alcohol dehydrogenase family)
MQGLEGKVIVVCAGGTGDGTQLGPGMGAATARRLAEAGAKVVVGDLDEAAAVRTAKAIVDAGGVAIGQAYDAGDDAQTRALVERAVSEYGGVGGVHFNATSTDNTSNLDGEHDLVSLPLDAWQRQLDVSLRGFLLVARYAIPHMLERGGGGIVGTSSAAAYLGEPVRVAYATAKAGMGAIARHIASRYGSQGIRANTVAPGLVPSEVMLADPRFQGMLDHPRSNRLGRADDIAGMVTFLLSEDGSWINGQAIGVDGATVMRP